MMGDVTNVIKIMNIVADKRFQFRVGLDMEHVSQLAEALAAKVEIEPLHVFQINGQHYLVDGFHRLSAYKKVEAKEVRVIVHLGTPQEALEFAAVCNLKHSYALPLTNAAKMSVLEVMYKPGGSWAGWSYNRLAAELGLKSHNTVKAWIETLVREKRLPEEVLGKTVVTKNGKTMDTSQIGQNKKQWGEAYLNGDGDVQPSFDAAIAPEEAHKQRLAAKIKRAVLMGWLDTDQAYLHRFAEMSNDPNNFKLKNLVTGEIIDPHTRPADKVAAERLAVARAEHIVEAEAKREEFQEELTATERVTALNRALAIQAPILKILETQNIEACLKLSHSDLGMLIMDIERGIERLQALKMQLIANDNGKAVLAKLDSWRARKVDVRAGRDEAALSD